jgi:phosphoenolpyruvate carboxykinase (ATP)
MVNTGLSGGPFGVGERIKIAYTRAMIHQALAGKLDQVPTKADPIFRLEVPQSCNGVPKEILDPRSTWRLPREYDAKARDLAARFRENFKQFSSKVSARVRNAGPGGI